MQKILDTIFALSQIAFLLLGSAIVITQFAGIVTLNGELAVWGKNTFALPAFYAASVTGLTGFTLSYFYKWKLDD